MAKKQQPREKPTQPGREPISVDAWKALEGATAELLLALRNRWRDPSFRLFPSFHSRQTSSFVTTASDSSIRTQLFNHAIRGLEGTKVDYRRNERTAPLLSDALYEFNMSWAGGPAPAETETAVERAKTAVERVVADQPCLRRAIMRVSWGPLGAETSDKREKGMFSDGRAATFAVLDLVEKVLRDNGITADSLKTLEIDPRWAGQIINKLQESVGALWYPRELLALLNCPSIDTKDPIQIWKGSWHGAPCEIIVGYPSDELCNTVLDDLRYDFLHGGLENINCFVALRYSVHADQASDDIEAVNWHAQELIRNVVDCVRVLFDADVGILHLTGISRNANDSILHPPYADSFQERPGSLSATPLRRIYQAPPKSSLVEEDLRRAGHLFDRFAVQAIQVRGLPAAMDRLRSVFERYAPYEPGRLLDAVTGLEALYLSGGTKDELKYRLQIRIARTLGSTLEERRGIAKSFSKIYSLRSEYVHTGVMEKVQRDVRPLLDQAVSYLRQSIEFFLTDNFAVGKTKNQMEDLWLDFVLSDPPGSPVDEAN